MMYMEEFIEKFNYIFNKLKTKKSIGIWGIGRHTELLFQHTILSNLSITHIIDKNQFGSKFMNFIVENPKDIDWDTKNIDTIIIVSLKYQDEIYQMLKETIHYSGEIITLYEKEDIDIFYLAQSKYMPIPSKLELQNSNLHYSLSRLKYDMRYSQVDSFETKFQKTYKQYHKIKIYQLFTERIGELIGRFFNILHDIQEDVNNFHLILPDNRNFDFCNSSLLELMGHKIEIINQDNFLFWNYIFDNYPNYFELSELNLYESRKFKTYLNVRNNNYIEFTKNQKKYAETKLQELKIKKEYVCLHIRDSDYLNNLSKKINLNVNWQYHDYRNSNIHNYESSISYLAKNQITTIRMGKLATTPFIYPGCIDYAFLYQEDLLDLYLLHKCKFFLGTTSGFWQVVQLFGVPCAIVNAIPIIMGSEGCTFIKEDLIIPKKLWDKNQKRYLNFYESFTIDMLCNYKSNKYQEYNIEPVENTSEEILDLVIEMNEKLDGTWQETKEMKELQKKYISIRDTWLKEYNMPIAGAIPCQIGSKFLLKNKFLLEIKETI